MPVRPVVLVRRRTADRWRSSSPWAAGLAPGDHSKQRSNSLRWVLRAPSGARVSLGGDLPVGRLEPSGYRPQPRLRQPGATPTNGDARCYLQPQEPSRTRSWGRRSTWQDFAAALADDHPSGCGSSCHTASTHGLLDTRTDLASRTTHCNQDRGTDAQGVTGTEVARDAASRSEPRLPDHGVRRVEAYAKPLRGHIACITWS